MIINTVDCVLVGVFTSSVIVCIILTVVVAFFSCILNMYMLILGHLMVVSPVVMLPFWNWPQQMFKLKLCSSN